MKRALKQLTGSALVGLSLLMQTIFAFAQPTGAASAASQPPGDGLKIPVDPTWLVAALVIGLVIGYLVGVARGRNAGTMAH